MSTTCISAPTSPLVPTAPIFPVEVLRHILTLADDTTLATSCQVSLALLEIASELLYTDVVVWTPRQVGLLFCDRDPHSSSPLISPLLSLNRIHTLFYHAPSWHASSHLPLHPHRYSHPLELSLLTIRTVTRTSASPPPPPQDGTRYFPLERWITYNLLPHLNPASFDFLPVRRSVEHTPLLSSYYATLPFLRQPPGGWTRLRQFRTRQTCLSSPNPTTGLLLRTMFVASPGWTYVVELEPAVGEDGFDTMPWKDLVVQLRRYWATEGQQEEEEGLRVTVVVGDEDERGKVERKLRDVAEDGAGRKVGERRMRRVAVVVGQFSD